MDRSKVKLGMRPVTESGLKPGDRFPDDRNHHIFPEFCRGLRDAGDLVRLPKSRERPSLLLSRNA